MDAVKTHSQSTWPVSMRPLHAGTQEKMMTGEKQEAAQTHGGNKHQSQEKHRHGPRPGRQLHTSHHKRTIAVLPVRGREDSALHKREAHTASSHPPMDEDEKRPTATASSSVPRKTGYSHSPAANTAHAEQAVTQRATRGSDSSSIHDAAPHPTRLHRVRHFLNRTYSSSIP
ncbi:hypothetical protein TcCL_Unassigned01566 [Trypanosoma cruzi]|nr:hypothetical protein TcCL_Unassigned01566 [Trypanosoma cruzi]